MIEHSIKYNTKIINDSNLCLQVLSNDEYLKYQNIIKMCNHLDFYDSELNSNYHNIIINSILEIYNQELN